MAERMAERALLADSCGKRGGVLESHWTAPHNMISTVDCSSGTSTIDAIIAVENSLEVELAVFKQGVYSLIISRIVSPKLLLFLHKKCHPVRQCLPSVGLLREYGQCTSVAQKPVP